MESENILKEFTTKSGKKAVIRPMEQADTEQLCSYINELSKEDTYILYSGEEINMEEEKDYVNTAIKNVQNGDSMHIVCEIEGKIVSSSSVERKKEYKKRTRHVVVLGISVAKEWRSEGVGSMIMQVLIDQAKTMKDIMILELHVFSNNQVAMNLYKKFGFYEVARLPDQIYHRDEYVDLVTMYYDF